MTKRVNILVLAGAMLLSACTGVQEHRGFVLDEQLVKSVQVGVDNKASVEKALGRPTFVGQFDPNQWYYLSQDTSAYAFRNPRVKKQTLLEVRFDAAGNVTAVNTTGKETIASVHPSNKQTPTLGRKRGFFDELFGNIGTIAQPGLPGGSPNGQ